MEYFPYILSGLALLAAVVNFILLMREKKRSEKRNAAALQYVDNRCDGYYNKISLRLSDERAFVNERFESQSTIVDNISIKVDKLEHGIVPDYAEAIAAKEAVDDFNKGLSAIMGFDPIAAVRKSREERMGGGN